MLLMQGLLNQILVYGLKPDWAGPRGRLQHPKIIVGFFGLLIFDVCCLPL